MDKLLYHYCSVDTFKKILENKTLRFSDVMKSNDSKEIVFLWEKYYKQIDSQASNKFAVRGLRFTIEQQLNNTAYLSLCFSKDDDSLHIWNCYGDGGIAIGFDVDKLKLWTKSICMHNYLDPSQPVENTSIAELREITYYDSDNVNDYVREVCKNAEFVTHNFNQIFKNAPFAKADFFKDEKEVRIIITIFLSENGSNMLDFVDSNTGECMPSIKLESKSNEKFHHILFCDMPFDVSMIRSITIGPNCSLTKSDLNQLLCINDINELIEVTKSKGSYR